MYNRVEMARRKSRKSKESRITLGLFFLLLSIILLIALLTESKGDNLFTVARTFFGQGLVVATFTSFNLACYFLDIQYLFTRGLSLIAQIGLTFLYPTFVSSLLGNEQQALELAKSGLAGGQLGHFIAWEIFFDRPFNQYTPLIVGGICAFLLLIAISVSLEQIANTLQAVLSWIADLIRRMSERREVDETPVVNESKFNEAKRFSDFQRQSNKVVEKPEEKIDTARMSMFNKQAEEKAPPAKGDDKHVAVEVKEREISDDDGLFTSELHYADWQLPPLNLLNPYKKVKPTEADVDRNSKIIEQTLGSFSIDAKVKEVYVGPSVVRYALDMPLGIKVAKVAGLGENLALALGVAGNQIRIEPIPGTTYLGIEAPRSKRDVVTIREMCEALEKNEKLMLGATIGKDISGLPVMADIKKMPHLLIAGATGSGKSVLTNAFITSLLMRKTPDELKLILVDPKQVELQDYNGIPHLLTPVITDMTKVVNALKWCVNEMELRYTKFAEAKVRNIEGYNEQMGFAAVPYIVVVIDEMADMMLTADRNEAETAIVRLAQKARATGIHLILATQRPSVNVITGIIKANIPGRVGMSVTSNTDSRVILDQIGAESLLGNGDLLYKAPDKTKPERVQSPLITQEEIGRVVNFIKAQSPEVSYATSILESKSSEDEGGPGVAENSLSDDGLFAQAVRVVVHYQKGSSSFLQRRLNIGFNRAARLLDEMEEAGVVGPPNGSKPREVLIGDADGFLSNFQGADKDQG